MDFKPAFSSPGLSLQLQQPTYLGNYYQEHFIWRILLNFPNQIFVGGVPAHVGEFALSQWHLRNSTSLQGKRKPHTCTVAEFGLSFYIIFVEGRQC
jgi:hypothetical protein